MTAPEAYIQYSTEMFADDGTILGERPEAFLTDYMAENSEHVQRVLTVLPRRSPAGTGHCCAGRANATGSSTSMDRAAI